jgi:hypothetical protein
MDKKIIVIAALLLTACSTYQRPKNLVKMEEYAIATQANHFVACKIAVKHPCGITLTECSDMMKYECTQSVLIINLNDLPKAYEEQ